MKPGFRSVFSLILGLCLIFGALCPRAAASDDRYWFRDPPPAEENDPSDPNAAQNITDYSLLDGFYGFYQCGFLFDGRTTASEASVDSAEITLKSDRDMGWLYLIFDELYGSYTLINNETGQEATCGDSGFLHEAVDLTALFGGPVNSLTLRFSRGPVRLCELSVFTPGYLPGYVQVWEPAKEKQTDLILFSTHGDDDQLFFAGLLPYYCALDYEVLVVYMSDHRNCHTVRVHEMLDGLWAAGVRTYPVLGSFPDYPVDTLSGAYAFFEFFGLTRDDLIEFILTQLRRYQPLVVVGHDFYGEYGHGQHMAYAECLAEALELSGDPSRYPELAETYGVWEVPKAYFHLYQENPIVMDWDTPMEELKGLTPFQVSQLYAYPQHRSQQRSWVSNWINGRGFTVTRADEITSYSPCHYGLYRSTVGEDVAKNDFFENLLSYAQQEEACKPPPIVYTELPDPPPRHLR